MKKITACIPEIFAPLMMKKYRIKFCYGGRAGGKSYAFADSLLLLGRKKKALDRLSARNSGFDQRFRA